MYNSTPIDSANRSPNYCPHGVYPARAETDPEIDAWVAIAVNDDAQWQALCVAMGRDELARDERFSSHAMRKRHEDELDALVGAWSADRDKWDIANELQRAGVAAAPVEHLKDMLERDPQLPYHYQQVRQPVAPDVDIPIDREAARWVGFELDLQRAPTLGEHNQYVLQEVLGLDDETFITLIADDVVS